VESTDIKMHNEKVGWYFSDTFTQQFHTHRRKIKFAANIECNKTMFTSSVLTERGLF